ncbi:MAG: CvpA family protein [Vulcanimicrobiaceae bacterium]
MTWPDILILAILLIGALKGFKRGLVSEIGGFIAIVIAFWAGLHYNGAFDDLAQHVTHATPGSAHVIAAIAFAIVIYIVLLVLSNVLAVFAKLPILGLANNVLGIPVGIVKAAFLVWAVIYVALLFPLPSDVRSDLRHSSLVSMATQPNAQVDAVIVESLPWFARPFVQGFLKSNRV